MYAPDVVRGNDGRYYLYYSLAGGTKTKSWASWIMSVAVCDTPCGKFEFLGNVQYKDGTIVKDFLMFDPGVFNDNGRIIMYYGFNSFANELPLEEQGPFHDKTMEEILANPYVSAYVELEDDMITVKRTAEYKVLVGVFTCGIANFVITFSWGIHKVICIAKFTH